MEKTERTRPLFSVVIPTFNRAGLLGKSMDSVLGQTFDDWELIVVDDGSTDCTSTVVLSRKAPRIRYHYQANQDLSAARNKGIQLAKGSYICFLDDDDYFLPSHLEALHGVLCREGFPVCLLRSGMLFEQGGVRMPSANFDARLYLHPVLFLWQNFVGILSFCFHREVFERYTFPEHLLLNEDKFLLYQALLDFPFFQTGAFTLVCVSHPGRRVNTAWANPEKVENYMQGMEALFSACGARLEAYVSPRMKKERISLTYLGYAHDAISHRGFPLALRYSRLAFRHHFSLRLLKNYAYLLCRFLAKLLFSLPRRVFQPPV